MNRIRMFALGALVAATAVAPVGAQGRPDAARPRRAAAAGDFGRGLFRGIQLTEQEKASLKVIREKYQPQVQQLRQQMQPQMQAAMQARRSGDTAAARIAFQKTDAQRQQLRALAEKMQQESRGALTPEHRAQLDSNVARMRERGPQAGRGVAAGRGARGQRAMRPGAPRGVRPGAGRFARPGRPGARPARGEFRGHPGAPFAGPAAHIQLSDAEKAKVKAIREKYQPQVQALRDEAQKDRQATRAKAEQLREQMHAEVRASLTPEHQKQLDSLKAARPNRPARRP